MARTIVHTVQIEILADHLDVARATATKHFRANGGEGDPTTPQLRAAIDDFAKQAFHAAVAEDRARDAAEARQRTIREEQAEIARAQQAAAEAARQRLAADEDPVEGEGEVTP
jgi:hypothetical protein